MKRMVLIPEERLLRYEERDKQRVENRDGSSHIPFSEAAKHAPTHACVDPTRQSRSQGCQDKNITGKEGKTLG